KAPSRSMGPAGGGGASGAGREAIDDPALSSGSFAGTTRRWRADDAERPDGSMRGVRGSEREIRLTAGAGDVGAEPPASAPTDRTPSQADEDGSRRVHDARRLPELPREVPPQAVHATGPAPPAGVAEARGDGLPVGVRVDLRRDEALPRLLGLTEDAPAP